MPRHKTGHLPGDPELTGKAKYRKVSGQSNAEKKVATKRVRSMDELMGKGWRDRGIKKHKTTDKTKRAVVTPKKKKFVSKRVIKKPARMTTKQKKTHAEARARKKRAMNVLKGKI